MTRSVSGSCAHHFRNNLGGAAWRVAIALAMALPLGAQATQPKLGPLVDEWTTKPVDDRTYRSFLPFFTYDKRAPFDARVTSVVDTGGLRRERVSFISTSGVRVTSYFVQQLPVSNDARPAIIFLHGGSRLGKDVPRYLQFADFFARAGYRVFAIDMPYFGERATDLMKDFTEEEKHEKLYNQTATYLAWVTQVVKDVGRAYDFLVAERRTDPTRVALMGFSRGGQLAYIVGAAEPRVKGVAALYAGHMDHLELEHVAAACPANYIGRIAPRPLFTMNGTNDADYSRDSTVMPLLKHAKKPVESVWLETGHSLPPENLRGPLLAWLQKVLQ
jgi:dienelactone hydrolase